MTLKKVSRHRQLCSTPLTVERSTMEEISITDQNSSTGLSESSSASPVSPINSKLKSRLKGRISLPLRRSDSVTTSPVKQRDLLRRKPRVRQTLDSDMRWLWAAYQLGMWRELMV